MVYDIEAERRSLAVRGHVDDGRFRICSITDYQSMPFALRTNRQPIFSYLDPTTVLSKFGIDDRYPLQRLPGCSSVLPRVSHTLRLKGMVDTLSSTRKIKQPGYMTLGKCEVGPSSISPVSATLHKSTDNRNTTVSGNASRIAGADIPRPRLPIPSTSTSCSSQRQLGHDF
jgi:hypothetical protein